MSDLAITIDGTDIPLTGSTAARVQQVESAYRAHHIDTGVPWGECCTRVLREVSLWPVARREEVAAFDTGIVPPLLQEVARVAAYHLLSGMDPSQKTAFTLAACLRSDALGLE